MQINVGWSDLKEFASSRSLSIQWVVANSKYMLTAIDGPMEMTAQVPCIVSPIDGSDQKDFEDNFKSVGNKSPNMLVTTQFELRNKTLKLASASGAVQSDGTALVMIKVPGTPNPTGDTNLDGRWISGGCAFFDEVNAGDMVTGIHFIDHDNMLGQGVDFLVGSYSDDEAGSNCGWFIPCKRGQLDAEPIGGYGFAPAGLYVAVSAKKAPGITTGTFFLNMSWGKVE